MTSHIDLAARPVVLIAEELSPATVEALGPDFDIRYCDGSDRDELLPAIGDADAVLVRSATKVDAGALAAARNLKVIARAGLASVGHTAGDTVADAAIMRRDAVLAAAVTVGLARRAGDEDALRAAWHRIAPVLAGADVELLLLDAWGELSAAAGRELARAVLPGMIARRWGRIINIAGIAPYIGGDAAKA